MGRDNMTELVPSSQSNSDDGDCSRRITLGELTIDLDARRVFWRDTEIELSPLEFRLLAHLAEKAGAIVSFEELLRAVWACPSDRGSLRQVRDTIYRLRQKIEPDPKHPRFVLAVVEYGYAMPTRLVSIYRSENTSNEDAGNS
jgi:DNA-binding response OmpR family regulator